MARSTLKTTGERGAARRDSTEAIDETLPEHDPEEPESLRVSDDSLSERDARDVESDDRADDETEVIRSIEKLEKRPGINGAVRPRRRV